MFWLKWSLIISYCSIEFIANFWTNYRSAFYIPRHFQPIFTILILFFNFYYFDSKLFAFFLSFIVFSVLNYYGNKIEKSQHENQNGKIFVITGVAENGIGYHLAKEILKLNGEVVLGCRNIEKTKKTIESLKFETKKEKVTFIQLDMSSMSSIKEFVNKFESKYDRLDVLMNNAGLTNDSDTKSKDGYEMSLAVNYLGLFSLTIELLPLIKRSNDGRIINTSSIEHEEGQFILSDWEGKNQKKSLLEIIAGGIHLYRRSKLFVNMFTRELQSILIEQNFNNVSVFCFHPGMVLSEIWKKGFPPVLYPIIKFLLQLRMMTPNQGALTGIHLATNKNVTQSKDLLKMFPVLKETKLLNVYLFGSRLFGTATEKSDFDFLVVCDDYDGNFILNSKENETPVDLNIISSKKFKEKILNYSYHELITIWFPKEYVYLEKYPAIDLIENQIEISQLRTTLSLQAKQVWERAKEKFKESKDFQKGRKGIIHSLRIFEFGSQIAVNGYISNFCVLEDEFNLMFGKYKDEEDWDKINSIFRKMYLHKHEEFKKNAPKK
eukprot:gene10842-3462_t